MVIHETMAVIKVTLEFPTYYDFLKIRPKIFGHIQQTKKMGTAINRYYPGTLHNIKHWYLGLADGSNMRATPIRCSFIFPIDGQHDFIKEYKQYVISVLDISMKCELVKQKLTTGHHKIALAHKDKPIDWDTAYMNFLQEGRSWT